MSDKSSESMRDEIDALFTKASKGEGADSPPTRPNFGPRKSPVKLYARALGDYYLTREVAEMLGVGVQTVRKLANRKDVRAPSYIAPFGKISMRLFTDADVEELREVLNDRYRAIPREEYERRDDMEG